MSGIGWPWTSSPVWINTEEVTEDGLESVLKTRNGERKMNFLFGSQVMQLVFENEGRALEVLANREIISAYNQLFPNVKVNNVDYIYHEETYKPTEILVKYEYLGEHSELVVPIAD